MFVYIIKVVIL